MPAELETIPFLRDRPHWLARSGSALLVAVAVVAGWFSVAVRLPDAVVGRFELRPPTWRGVAITVPAAGVLTRVLADEGEAVAAGQVLVRVSAPGAAEALDARLRLARLRDELDALDDAERRALRVFEARAEALEPVVERHAESIPLLRQTARLAAEELAQAEELHRQGLLTAVELHDERAAEVRVRLELRAEQSALARARAERAEVLAEQELAASEHAERRRRLRDELHALESSMPGHRGLLDATDDGELVARAPCAGTVAERRVAEAGQSVAAGQVLMLVHCEDDPLHAALHLPQAELPRVRPGHPVKLMYDALPYQRWGIRYGTVRHVSPVSDAEGRFVVHVELDEQVVETAVGTAALRPGMSGAARIVVGRRTLLDHALAPLRGLREVWETERTP